MLLTQGQKRVVLSGGVLTRCADYLRALALVLCILLVLAESANGACRCIISEDEGEGPKVAFNFHSRKEYRRLPLLNSAEVDKALWHVVVDADVEVTEDGAKLTNIVKVNEPPPGEWLIAITGAPSDVVRREAPALITKYADSPQASKAAKFWAETYERKLAWADALKIYEDFMKNHPQDKGLSSLMKAAERLKTHCIGKPNWGRFYLGAALF